MCPNGTRNSNQVLHGELREICTRRTTPPVLAKSFCEGMLTHDLFAVANPVFCVKDLQYELHTTRSILALTATVIKLMPIIIYSISNHKRIKRGHRNTMYSSVHK